MNKPFLFAVFVLGAYQLASQETRSFEEVSGITYATNNSPIISPTIHPDVSELSCETFYDVKKLANLAVHSTIIIGEAHGYNEPANFTKDLLCQSFKDNHKISLGLELSYSMNAKLQVYFNSNGLKSDKETFLSDPVWLSPIGDGRYTLAIFNLIEYARKLRAMGHDIYIYAYQASNVNLSNVAEGETFNKLYEITLYKNISEFTTLHNSEKDIVLVGNAHARVGMASFGGSTYKTMASYFSEPNTITLNYKVRSEKKGDVEIFNQPENGYNGVYYVEEMTKAANASLK